MLGDPMTTTIMKITQKGRVTIPKIIRNKLNTDVIYFEIENDIVVIKPVRDAAGSLREWYVKPGISMKKMKSKAWKVAVRDKT